MVQRFQQDSAVEGAPLEDEMILYHPDASEFCTLNQTASVIWSRVEQPATVEEIVAEVSARFAGVTEAQALHDVEEALRQMIDLHLVARV